MYNITEYVQRHISAPCLHKIQKIKDTQLTVVERSITHHCTCSDMDLRPPSRKFKISNEGTVY